MFDEIFIQKLAEAVAPKLAHLLLPVLKPNPLPTQEWFTRTQAAHYIGTSVEALRHMIREGMFPVYSANGRDRLRRSDMDRFWLSNRQRPKD